MTDTSLSIAAAPVVPSPMPASARPPHRRLLAWLAMAAFLLTAYLTAASLRLGHLAGCDAASGCSNALGSVWSSWRGVPVGLLGAVTYLVLLGCLALASPTASFRCQRWAWGIMLMVSVVIFGAAAWFLFLMFFTLKSVCLYCLAAHILGLIIVALVGGQLPRLLRPTGPNARRLVGPDHLLATFFAGLMVVGAFAGAQALFPAATFAVVPGIAVGSSAEPDAPPAIIPYDSGPGPARRITLPLISPVEFLAHQSPFLGSADAPHVLVLFYDYTCLNCREMHSYLLQAQQRYGDQIAILLAAASISGPCNRSAPPREDSRHDHACEYAKLSLAVWKADARQFEAFEVWLITGDQVRPIDQAIDGAVKLIGRQRLIDVLSDATFQQWSGQWIERNLDILRRLPEQDRRLPILFLKDRLVSGTPEKPRQLFEILEQQLGIRPLQRPSE